MLKDTLTSLAILKVNVDQGTDYLDYLRPFVFQILTDHNFDPITSSEIARLIRRSFGLEIPSPTIEAVLRRLSKRYPIRRVRGIYRKVGSLPDPGISAKRAEVERHIDSVLNGLKKFSEDTLSPIVDHEEAVNAVTGFLAEFSITCLRAYLRGTAIPNAGQSHDTKIILVSDYVQHLQRTDPERFNSFLVLVQGHMLANALMCPDLQNVSGTFRNVTFYFDTPLLIQRLGHEGDAKLAAISELISLVRNLDGKVAAFAHSQDEVRRVLIGASNYLDSPDARGAVVFEARRRGTTKSDLVILAESSTERIAMAGVEVENTPDYTEAFQIDETAFEEILEDEVSYYNPRAKEYDINSVRSIYVIRGEKITPSIEKSHGIFVTSNSGFARAAWEYGQQFDVSRNVSSVISDFTLANVAWLKAPMGAPDVPATQVLAFAYAAMEPSKELLNKYLKEIDRLEKSGSITERDHQLLRSSPSVYPELMHLTLGDDASLTQSAVEETLERVSGEIKKEESEKLSVEQQAHQETREVLNAERNRTNEIVKGLYWRCRKRARKVAWGVSGALTTILTAGLFIRLMPLPIPVEASWSVSGAAFVVILATLVRHVTGHTIRDGHRWIEDVSMNWLLKREARSLGIDPDDLVSN